MYKSYRSESLCVYCQSHKATTRDHVPPRALFLPPRPDNLITVPACCDCNNGASSYDERFASDLRIAVQQTSKHPKTKDMFDRVVKTYERNKKLREEKISTIRDVDIFSSGGIFVEHGSVVEWDIEARNSVLERTVRGLYWHQYQRCLSIRADVAIHYTTPSKILSSWEKLVNISKNSDLSLEFPSSIQELPIYNIDDGAFCYWCFNIHHGEDKENEIDFSVWFMCFYRALWFSAHTITAPSKTE